MLVVGNTGTKLSLGSSLLNIACSGSPYWGMTTGKYYWMVGDSSSGKTFLTLGTLAEASINKAFDDYDLVYDNAEDGALMDVEKFFGPKLAARLMPPKEEDGFPVYSSTVEEFYFNLDDRIQMVRKGKAKKFIYLLDSMDALSTKYEGEKFDEKKKAFRTGKEAKGEYGDGKAKVNSTWIRRIVADLRDTDCILIVLSQTRDNIGAGMFEPQQTHAGGHALKFYATWQLWSSVGSKLKKEVNGKDRQIGIISRVAIKKNRLTGKESSVEIPIYYDLGVDDVGSIVDWMVAEKIWAKDGSGRISVPAWDFVGTRSKLISLIEIDSLEMELKDMLKEGWDKIEEQLKLGRKPRYT